VASTPFRYQSPDEDSARWLGFPFRDDDIVISTRSKTGTTWVQMICALLIFQTPDLPAPLAQLSPWLDHLIVPREQVYAELAAQEHRRFIKTHTPLDGIPLDPRATYIVTARDPLDMAVSLYHQSANIDHARLRQLTGEPEPGTPRRARKPLRDWLLGWIAREENPREQPDSLPGVMWHLSDAWARRGEPNVLLVHYDDLATDLPGQMRWLAGRLGITVADQTWPALARAASFEAMRARADRLVPTAGIFKDNAAFFRRGTSGAGHEFLTPDELAAYHARVGQLAPPDLLAWLHRAARTNKEDQ
jgi:aryl sulfotransferase